MRICRGTDAKSHRGREIRLEPGEEACMSCTLVKDIVDACDELASFEKDLDTIRHRAALNSEYRAYIRGIARSGAWRHPA